MLLNKKKQIKKTKQSGGTNVIEASLDLIRSMKDLGASVFTEIFAITNIQSDINNGASPSQGTPNVMSGPSNFNPPNLETIPNK